MYTVLNPHLSLVPPSVIKDPLSGNSSRQGLGELVLQKPAPPSSLPLFPQDQVV